MDVFAIDYDNKIMKAKKKYQENNKPATNTSSAVGIYTIVRREEW